jgi:hypothetical protein
MTGRIGNTVGMALFFHHSHEVDDELPVETPDERLADHAMGIELQLFEIARRREEAVTWHDDREVRRLDAEAATLHAELAETGLHYGEHDAA